ncbi:MAG: 4'-phosphopantetheinyl transferase superfamily protein [Terriglobales bacterium]
MNASASTPDSKPRSTTSWPQLTSPPGFPTDRIDIWKVSLDEPAHDAAETNVLSPDEIARASRFHFEQDRLRFIRCRSALRGLLSAYLSIPAAEVLLEYQSNGKPYAAPSQNPRALQFNVSHSASTALIAVGSCCQLGVDIEKIREDVDVTSLAERFFSLTERAELRALPAHLRVPGFFACWTRKEAFLKATGIGLSFPLADFSVTTHPDYDPTLIEIKGDTESAKQWLLADLAFPDTYRAAVALDRPNSQLATFTWPPM